MLGLKVAVPGKEVGLLTRWNNPWFTGNAPIEQPSVFVILFFNHASLWALKSPAVLLQKKNIHCLGDQKYA